MKFRLKLRQKWPHRHGVAKYVYLTDREVSYQLLRNKATAPLDNDLEKYYSALIPLADARRNAFKLSAAMLALALLSKLNLVSAGSLSGVTLAPIALKHALLAAYAATNLYSSIMSVKFMFVAGIFETHFYKCNPSQRVDLLCRYPIAFDSLKFSPLQIGTLPHTAPRVPKRMIAIVFLVALAVPVSFLLSLWLTASLSYDVWNSVTSLPSFWSKIIASASLLTVIASYALPFDLLFKRRYLHIGFVKMMNRAHREDRPRYLRYLAWIERTREAHRMQRR